MMSYSFQKSLMKTLRYIVLTVFILTVLIPLLVILSSSFKSEQEIFDVPFHFIPKEPVTYNFSRLAENFPLYTWNSVKLTFIISVVQLLTSTTGAYVFSKIRWKGREFIFMLYLMSMMIPSQAITIPQFLIIRNIGLYDSHLALVLIGAFTAFGTFLIRQYLISIPETYSEAARIDGAGEWKIFGLIMMPMAKSVLVTQAIFSFRHFWNDFYAPLIYITSPELKTLPLGMTDFAREQYTYWGPQMAAALISIIPVLIIFVFCQRYFIQGVASSGIK